MHPVDAIWTGGTTTIVVDPLHVIQDCRERAGRRVPVAGRRAGGSERACLRGQLAGLRSQTSCSGRHGLDESCLVRGRLLVGPAAPVLECELIGWSAAVASRELDIDLPPTWIPDRVQWSGQNQSLSWNPTIQADGGTRLHVLLPGREGTPDDRALIVATSTAAAGRGPLVLPRVRPSGLAILDEMWVALVDRTMSLIPISARGLAWIDPSRVEGAIGSKSALSPDVHAALAWRWNSENAAGPRGPRTGRVSAQDRDPIPRESRTGRAAPRRRRPDSDQAGQQSTECLPVWVSQPAGGPQDWSFRSGPEQKELIRHPLDDPARSRLGFPRPAWPGIFRQLARARRQSGSLQGRLPWKQRGAIPLISVPRRFSPRTTILLEIPSRTRTRVETVGLRRIDITMAERLAASWQPEPRPDPAGQGASERACLVAHAFTYTEPGGKLELSTEELVQSLEVVIIRDVCLTSLLHPSGPWLNRLRLLLHAEKPADLQFTLPTDSRLIRVRLDGADIVPTLEDGRIVVSLQRGSPALRYKTVDLDFETSGRTVKPGAELRPVLPRIGMPCFSFCWELITPPCWQARSYGPGLLPSDPELLRSGRLVHWGFRNCVGPAGNRHATDSDEILRRLDEILAGTPSEELTFAECFTRWDSGTTPLIIDRLALSGAGHGPRSRCIPNRVGPRGQPLSMRTLQQYGLTLLRLDSGLVITSQGEAARSDQADGGSERWARHASGARIDPIGSSPWRGGEARSLPPTLPWAARPSPCVRLPAGQPGDSPARAGRARQVASSCAMSALASSRLDGRASGRPRSELVARPSPQWAILLPITIVFLAVLFHLWQADDRGSFSAGVFVGAMASLLYRLGSQLTAQRPRERSVPIQSGTTSTAAFRVPLRAAPLLLAVFLIPQDRAEARRDEEQPIPVLMPYEGTFQPGQARSMSSCAKLTTSASRSLHNPGRPWRKSL